jgi:hypothetical protein
MQKISTDTTIYRTEKGVYVKEGMGDAASCNRTEGVHTLLGK